MTATNGSGNLHTVVARDPPFLFHCGEGYERHRLPVGTTVIYPNPPLDPLPDQRAAIAHAIDHPDGTGRCPQCFDKQFQEFRQQRLRRRIRAGEFFDLAGQPKYTVSDLFVAATLLHWNGCPLFREPPKFSGDGCIWPPS